jgi:hypothetical protein
VQMKEKSHAVCPRFALSTLKPGPCLASEMDDDPYRLTGQVPRPGRPARAKDRPRAMPCETLDAHSVLSPMRHRVLEGPQTQIQSRSEHASTGPHACSDVDLSRPGQAPTDRHQPSTSPVPQSRSCLSRSRGSPGPGGPASLVARLRRPLASQTKKDQRCLKAAAEVPNLKHE